MKTRLILGVAGLMISTAIFAQNTDSPKAEPRGHERMKQELGLTDKQYASVKDIHAKYAKKRIEEREKFQRMRMEERETMRTLRLEREREMRNVLTPEQSKKWDEHRAMQKNRYQYHKGKMHRPYKHFRKDHRTREHFQKEKKQKD